MILLLTRTSLFLDYFTDMAMAIACTKCLFELLWGSLKCKTFTGCITCGTTIKCPCVYFLYSMGKGSKTFFRGSRDVFKALCRNLPNDSHYEYLKLCSATTICLRFSKSNRKPNTSCDWNYEESCLA